MMMRYSKFIVLSICVIAGSIIVNNGLVGGGKNWRSSLADAELPELVDSRPICSGPRRPKTGVDAELREPFLKRASNGIHLGISGTPYGQFNNRLIALIHVVDVALDSGGQTIVVVSDWMVHLLNQFFPNDESWERLEQDFPITRNSTALELGRLMQNDEDIFSPQNTPILGKKHLGCGSRSSIEASALHVLKSGRRTLRLYA
jgi:hypothetical protein